MLNGIYEINSKKDDVDITPGDRFTLEWGISQYLPINADETLLVELGITGYGQWQVSDDSGSDVSIFTDARDRVYGAGIQLGVASVPRNASLTFRYVEEYDAEARFEGKLYTLTIAKGF